MMKEPIAGQDTGKGQDRNDDMGVDKTILAIAGSFVFAFNMSFVHFLSYILTEQKCPQRTGKPIVKHVVRSHVGRPKDFADNENL